ncbi:AMP nucleosidase [Candidatus Kinetoplastibacterium desouzaii TCC079E]|uniref:AMP nucleosidase n=1 Tax=Candidatus Kinetoplastidibacterium desouzai TCC079E TaxID=1208919 RepID=M1LM88_9PROT|nr:AMP nucleosidase [Candidatus Kinetoplastibacterium desouzaii]AGF46837.1 AMP nucleosidase [Candidatus Kinetoplastibacterium desouzaii TCC079E]
MDSIFIPKMEKKNFRKPQPLPFIPFAKADKAVDYLIEIYDRNTEFLRSSFKKELFDGQDLNVRIRAYYPAIRISVSNHDMIDSRFSYGHVAEPGVYQTTITRPKLFKSYLIDQINQLIKNHNVEIWIGESDSPIPIHFAFTDSSNANIKFQEGSITNKLLRDIFDVPDLSVTDDAIVNGTWKVKKEESKPLAPFTAARIDYSLQRLQHYTATSPEHFQNYILFTNYQFYVDEFCGMAKKLVDSGSAGYTALVEPGNKIITKNDNDLKDNGFKMPQMPAYHLVRENHSGITLVNIGVGPSNAKTITDHIAVLRPHVWLMLGHCAGLRDSQRLGDYVLAHGYVRDDHVLDIDLPIWVPVPALAEVQVALENAVEKVSGLSGWELKHIMRTGTVVTIDNRNWELHDQTELVKRFSQSRAIALDMESGTIAANGFRFRVPYGTLLCVSDKPLHGELKLPGMANDFYRTQVNKHLEIGIKALEMLREMPSERLHSRKLRTFMETAFQ